MGGYFEKISSNVSKTTDRLSSDVSKSINTSYEGAVDSLSNEELVKETQKVVADISDESVSVKTQLGESKKSLSLDSIDKSFTQEILTPSKDYLTSKLSPLERAITNNGAVDKIDKGLVKGNEAFSNNGAIDGLDRFLVENEGNIYEAATGLALMSTGIGFFVGVPLLLDAFTQGEKTAGEAGDLAIEIVDILDGTQARDKADLEESQKELDRLESELLNYLDTLDYGFLGEIFAMSIANKTDTASAEYEGKLEKLQEEMKDFIDKYKMTDKLSNTFVGRFTIAIAQIVGGLENTAEELLQGHDVVANLTTLVGTVLTSIASIGLVIAGTALIAFGSAFGAAPLIALGVVAVVGGIAGLVSMILTLDAKFGQGALFDSGMFALDAILNNVAGLSQYESEFKNLKRDSQHYEELKGYIQTGLAIAAVIGSLASAGMSSPSPDVFSGLLSPDTADTLSNTWSAYQSASSVNDIVEANRNLIKAKEELRKQQVINDTRIRKSYTDKIMKSYAEVANIQGDEDLLLASYVASIPFDDVQDPAMMVKGDVSIARGSTLSKDSLYGFEDILNFETKAGGNSYITSIMS